MVHIIIKRHYTQFHDTYIQFLSQILILRYFESRTSSIVETVHVQTHTHARTSTKHRLCRHHEVDCGHGSKIFTSIRYEIDVRRGRASIGDRPRCNRRCEFNELVAWACVSVCLSESHVNVQPVVIYMFSIRVYHCVCIYMYIYNI